MAIDFTSIDSIIGGFNKILNLSSVGTPTPVPAPLIFIGVPQRNGLSAIKIASRINSRKAEAGLPVGTLPSGNPSPDELMEIIRAEEYIKALQQEIVISVAIPPGITISAAGASPAGPVTVVGSTIMYAKGYGIIQ